MSGSANRGESPRPLDSRDDDPQVTRPAVGSHMLDQILELASGGSPKPDSSNRTTCWQCAKWPRR